MSYLEDILSSAQGGQLIANLAERFGLTPEQMDSAVRALAPALEIGMTRAAEDPSTFEKLIGALTSPDQQGAYEFADVAHANDTVAQSRELLSDLFGSPAAAGQIVQVAARNSGLRPDILSQLLPVLASVLLGGLFKNVNNQGLGGILGQLVNSGALGSVLEQVLGGGRPPQQEPIPQPRGGGGLGGGLGGGGLGGLLGGLLGSLLGGGRRGGGLGGPNQGPMGGSPRGRVDSPLDVDGGGNGPGGLPEGLDQAAIQQAIEQIKNQLQIGKSGAGSGGGGQSELESILGQMFGRK